MQTDDVILAVASPPGHALRGIIRLSGHDAFRLLAAHLAQSAYSNDATNRPAASGDAPPIDDAGCAQRGMHRVCLHFDDLDLPALALLAPGPRSYTGEHCAELQLPGHPALLEMIIDGLLASATSRSIDARRAGPGEFTARAFMHHKLSLTEAEGVAASIAARSDAELRAAHLLTGGALGRLAHDLADRLATALALVEAGIDFTDQDDVVAISPRNLHSRVHELRVKIAQHLDRAVGAEQLQAIPWVVLLGAPNAGKSTLFNALLGRRRAVVSAVHGTTRDVLAEPLAIDTPHGPAEVMLVDLAGLDDDPAALNAHMQRAAREAMDRAELILRCVPVDAPPAQDAHEVDFARLNEHELIVHTKADLCDDDVRCASNDELRALTVSAATGVGLDDLRSAIARRLSDRAVSLAADALALAPRHEACLRAAGEHLDEALALVVPSLDQAQLADAELIAATLRAALDELASLAGDITPDDVLGRIFATFCVGK